MEDIKTIINNIDDNNQNSVDWTTAWSNKYPILNKYQKEVDISLYASKINEMFFDLKNKYGYSKQDAMLVLKDILYHEYKGD